MSTVRRVGQRRMLPPMSVFPRIASVCSLGPLRGEDVQALAEPRDDLSEIDSPGVRIEEQLLHSGKQAPKVLLFGSQGCGKSTELSRLESRWNDRFLVVGLPVELNQVRHEALEIEELLVLIAVSLARAASDIWDLDLGDELADVERAIQPLLSSEVGASLKISKLLEGLVLFGTNLVDPTGTASHAVTSLLQTTAQAVPLDVDLGGLVRRTQTRNAGEAISGAIAAMSMKIKLHGRPPLLLLDGLDKIEIEHVDTIWQLLTRHAFLSDLPFPVVLTAPIHLVRHYRLRPLLDLGYTEAFLYDVCVRDPADPRRPLESGVEKLRAMLRRRLRRACERESLNEDQVVEPDAVDYLIEQSGGSVRDLIQLLQTAAIRAGISKAPTISRRQAEEAALRLRRTFEVGLSTTRRDLLLDVMSSAALPDTDESFTLLDRGLIRAYSHNGRLFYWPHQCVLELLDGH